MIQKRGFSVDDEEFIDGMVAIALPLYDQDDNFMAALFCHCPKSRKDVAELENYLPILRAAQQNLEKVYQDMKSQLTK
ncbi:transcriptional regulator IclR family [Vibrio maritimus]|uniref:Transcriptional regulator IclR family n=1 Tax=Vibrio maritimus TaxID=990268 RepID=A0A090RZS4_9VIBR|nr:transcriptional regulator IclR family [Vibrio maritimus]